MSPAARKPDECPICGHRVAPLRPGEWIGHVIGHGIRIGPIVWAAIVTSGALQVVLIVWVVVQVLGVGVGIGHRLGKDVAAKQRREGRVIGL